MYKVTMYAAGDHPGHLPIGDGQRGGKITGGPAPRVWIWNEATDRVEVWTSPSDGTPRLVTSREADNYVVTVRDFLQAEGMRMGRGDVEP